jgi:CRP-like cAMP-binding protein
MASDDRAGPKPGGSPAPQAGNLNDPDTFILSIKASEFIFRERDPLGEMFVIAEGWVRLTRQHAGRERLVAQLEAGDFFGEVSLLEGLPREVSARAITDCRLFRIDAATFDRLVQEAPEIPLRMLRKLARRLRQHVELGANEAAGAIKPEGSPSPAEPIKQRTAGASAGGSSGGTPVKGAKAAAKTAWLVHVSSGTRLTLPAGRDESIIGRADRATGFKPDLDLTKFDTRRTVGRQHARIVRRDGVFFVREEQARNGTFLNGQRIAPRKDVMLSPGDEIRFGLVETMFEVLARPKEGPDSIEDTV